MRIATFRRCVNIELTPISEHAQRKETPAFPSSRAHSIIAKVQSPLLICRGGLSFKKCEKCQPSKCVFEST